MISLESQRIREENKKLKEESEKQGLSLESQRIREENKKLKEEAEKRGLSLESQRIREENKKLKEKSEKQGLSLESQRIREENKKLKEKSEKQGLSLESQHIREENKKLKEEVEKRGLSLESQRVHKNEKLQTQKRLADVCFLMDCTGSMDRWITATKDKIHSISHEVQVQFPDIQLRLGFVAYRDFGDSPQYEVLNFTTNVDEFYSFVKDLRAFGGGDTPEDVFGGFDKCLGMDWSSGIRTLVHFADAPCHGKIYHNVEDNKPNFDDGTQGKEYMKKLVYKRIDYYFGQITNVTEKMTALFRQWYDAHETKQLPMVLLSLDANTKDFFQRVVEAVTTSIKSKHTLGY